MPSTPPCTQRGVDTSQKTSACVSKLKHFSQSPGSLGELRVSGVGRNQGLASQAISKSPWPCGLSYVEGVQPCQGQSDPLEHLLWWHTTEATVPLETDPGETQLESGKVPFARVPAQPPSKTAYQRDLAWR